MRTKKILSIITSMTIIVSLVFSWIPAAYGNTEPATQRSLQIAYLGDSNEPVSGAQFTLTSQQNAEPIIWDTSGEPHELTLAPGTYTLTETVTPKSFVALAPLEFTVAEDGTITTDNTSVSIDNSLMTIRATKDEATGQDPGSSSGGTGDDPQQNGDDDSGQIATQSINLGNAGSDLSITGVKDLLYNGQVKNLSITVKYQGATLTANTDYTLSFKNSSGATVTTLKDVGTYYAVITGMGQYSGTVENKFEIYKENVAVQYRSHVQTYGWQGWVQNAQTSGTTGQSKRVEAVMIKVVNDRISGGVTYRLHGQNYGWSQGWKSNGKIAGTIGQSRRVEAIQIKLTGNLASEYDIYYRVHMQTYGWGAWYKNGEIAGTTGLSKRIESMQIKLVPKGTAMPYTTPNLKYVNGKAHGIDVSEFQRYIDWAKVKASGKVNFAFIRGGFRGYESGTLVADKWFTTNIRGATNNGIPVGVYFFSQAINEAEGAAEADYICNLCKQYNISLPIVIDTEASGSGTGRADNLSRTQRTKVIKAFCERVKQRGYTPMIYASTSWLNNNLDMSKLQGYRVWCAQYYYTCQYKGVYDVWQYTSTGIINGINGYVDCNWYYKR